MKLHHIGYLTEDIAATSKTFEVLGYVKQREFDDSIQNCRICFLKREESEPMIELVQPNTDNRSMQMMLSKRGTSPYHVCYEVEDIQATYRKLSEADGWLSVCEPIRAIALGDREITFFINAETGYVEFLNKQ